MREDIRKKLLDMSESDYQKFSASLIPGVKNMLGIRLPELRKLAKEIEDMDKILPYITAFIPIVDNWSVCDSVFMGMTVFQRDRERTWDYIQPYLQSDKEFEIRVAIIIMMQHLLKCDANGKKISRLRTITMENFSDDKEVKGLYLDRILSAADNVNTTAYYASMADAWFIAEAFCCFPYHTYQFLKANHLDNTTYNKAIQKIVESRIPSDDVKILLRSLKR